MRKLFAALTLILACLSAEAQIYLYNPTNAPGTTGQQLFSSGVPGYYYWGWGTNAQSSNATVVVASPSIGVSTNGFGYTPFFSASSSNWIYSLMLQGTNETSRQVGVLGTSATNNDNKLSIAGTNEVTRQIGQLVLTNVVVIQGANMTVVTNVAGGVTSYTVSTSASGSTTNVFIAAGANVTVTTNVVGSSTIYTVAASIGAGVAVAAGADILMSTNAGIVTIAFNTNATGIATLTGTNGATMQFGGTPPGVAFQLTNVNGVLFQIDTNGVIQTNVTFGLFASKVQRIAAGTTNGFMNTWNIIDFGASPALADNSTAIQNALNAASTNGGRVFIPAATNAYTCTSTINIPDGVTLEGETVPYGGGNGNASQIFNSSSAIVLTFGNGCVVKNVLIQGSGVNGTQIGVVNRYTTVGISGYQFEGCLIKNLAVGIVLSNTWDGFFPNNTVSACQRSVVFSNYANSITFVAGHYGSSGYGTSIGFDIRGDDLQQKSNLSFIGCVMEVSSNSFCLRGGGGGWDNINISGYGEGSTNVIYASGGLNLNIDHFSFVQSGGTATTNIVLRGVKQVAMDHCYFFNSVAFDADSATFGLSFDKNYVESGVTWNNRATTSTIDDNTNVVYGGKTLWGNGNGLTNIPLSGLAQSGAASGQVPKWNGSAWAATDVQGVTIPATITGTNFIANQFYTNKSGSVQLLDASIALITAGVSGVAAMDLMVDQSGGNTFALADRLAISTLITSLAMNFTNNIACALSNNAVYYFTNTSSGSGDSSAIVPGTGELITLSDGAAANVASLGANNVFTGNNVLGGRISWTGDAAGNLGLGTNVNGGAITGRIDSIRWDISCANTNAAFNSNVLSYITEGVTSISLQGSNTFPWLLLPLSTNGTNQFGVQMYMFPSWNSNAISCAVKVMNGTNSPLTSTSMVWSVSYEWGDLSSGTVGPITNNIPLIGGLCETNINVGAIPAPALAYANESLKLVYQYWASNAGKRTNVAYAQGWSITYTNSPVQNALVTGW